MNILNDLDGPFGREFSILWAVKQSLIDSGREDEVTKFLAEATIGDLNDLMSVASKYVDIDGLNLSQD